MPRFTPFRAIRYAATQSLAEVIAPPYDVLSDDDIAALAKNSHNIVWIDVPGGDDSRYEVAANRLREWLASGVLVREEEPAYYMYRLAFTDTAGRSRIISGVLGGLEVVDEGAGGVLAHEQTTPKASEDRLNLTKATAANISPVWGLSLATGLTKALAKPGEPIGEATIDGVRHVLERVTDPRRMKEIRQAVEADDVLLADGHHRYGVAREYRDLVRKAVGAETTSAEETLAFVNELTADQLAVDPIHRVYDGMSVSKLRTALEACFEIEDIDGEVNEAIIRQMSGRNRLVLVSPGGKAQWLIPRSGAFDGVRAIDGAWLEHALAGAKVDVDYQHDWTIVCKQMESKDHDAAILIRPPSLDEIIRTARKGVLMPPKSTYFTPKLRTGFVVRATARLPRQD